MTASTPEVALRRLMRTVHPSSAAPVPADAGDRIFVTLLSLNFMLLAFFVVLGTAASFDQPRAASVVKSVRVAFAASTTNAASETVLRLTARQALQSGVSEAFAEVLPIIDRTTVDNGDRVDVAVPRAAMIGDSGTAAELLIDAVARLMHSAPAGVHYQLILDGGGDNDLAAIATALIARDVSPRHLMVGTDAVNADLRFSFLLLEGDDEPAFGRLATETSP